MISKIDRFGIHKLLGWSWQSLGKATEGNHARREIMNDANTWQGENERGTRLYQQGHYAQAEQ
ncbi:MAG: hypothetical protein ACRERD_11485, partial [Candidatus Binatia bacterium]